MIAVDPRTGKRKEVQKTHEGSLAEARELHEQLRKEIEAGQQARRKVRLTDYVQSWLRARAPHLKPSTASKYAHDLEKHILPALGDYYIDMLRPSDVKEFIRRQIEEGHYAGYTIANRLRVLRVIAKDAVADELTDCYFCARVELPRCREYADDENRLTAEELATLLRHLAANEGDWYAVLATMAFTGIRFGEATGLRWDDVDFEGHVLRIRRNNWRGQAVAPKTKRSRRDVPISEQLAATLRDHRKRMLESQHPGLQAGWVFPTKAGTLHRGWPLRAVLDRALRKVGIVERLTPHGLRRTWSQLIRKVARDHVAKAMGGWTTNAMLDHYGPADRSEKQAAADAFGQLVGRVSD
ncbi:MAG TPA: site-specific integrase [Haliangiales bacterium]|nr:site-specific integrase [Haliangiales bacterium]